ncbi:MAG: hypothetical protein KGL11_05650 [Alphaproteobacteria bacterium]|nr:hypothetical protein [Alphaproteobacteria bacterium]
MGSGAFWLALAAKMAVTAAFVVGATRAAERAGPLVGAMVATLPISAGPAYLLLALEHDAGFIAASAVASLTANVANIMFCIVHAAVAQRRGLAASVVAPLAAWFACAAAIHAVAWTLADAIGLNLVVLGVGLPIANRFRHAAMPPVRRHWSDVAVRAGMVVMLVAVVVGLSARVGPAVTGIFALFPIVLLSVVLIFQPRIGGPPTAALTANAVAGLAGLAVALVALRLAAVPLGAAAALGLALVISVGCNLAIGTIRR